MIVLHLALPKVTLSRTNTQTHSSLRSPGKVELP